MRDGVFSAIQECLKSRPRTKSFAEDQAKAALFRRHKLWVCRTRTNGGQVAIAEKYYQLTGEKLTRQIVARQLEIVDEDIKTSKRRKRHESEMKEI